MANWQRKNIEVYNNSAAELAAYFEGIGPRTEDIDRALVLADADQNAKAVEIGCGDGRDAEVITSRVAWYEGVDPSAGLLALARLRLPTTSFVESDALSYSYPENLDVVYAFASLLHVRREHMAKVFELGATALKSGGVYYVSLKEKSEYCEAVKQDTYGERMFYYYTPQLINELSGPDFEPIYESHQTIGKTDWFTLALRKQN